MTSRSYSFILVSSVYDDLEIGRGHPLKDFEDIQAMSTTPLAVRDCAQGDLSFASSGIASWKYGSHIIHQKSLHRTQTET